MTMQDEKLRRFCNSNMNRTTSIELCSTIVLVTIVCRKLYAIRWVYALKGRYNNTQATICLPQAKLYYNEKTFRPDVHLNCGSFFRTTRVYLHGKFNWNAHGNRTSTLLPLIFFPPTIRPHIRTIELYYLSLLWFLEWKRVYGCTRAPNTQRPATKSSRNDRTW